MANVNIGGSSDVISVAYGNGLYVAILSNGFVHWSRDAQSWEQSYNSPDNTDYVLYGKSRFVTLGHTRYAGQYEVGYSSDGDRWSKGTINSTEASASGISGIFDGTRFIFVIGRGHIAFNGKDTYVLYTSESSVVIATSTDGQNFTAEVVNLGGSGERFLHSSNLKDWEVSVVDGTLDTMTCLMFGNGMFVAAGQTPGSTFPAPGIAYSKDGINWQLKKITVSAQFRYFTEGAFGSGVFVLTDNVENLWISLDGINFVDSGSNLAYPANQILVM